MEKSKKYVIPKDGPFKGMRVGHLYRITNIQTSEVYIGKTKNEPNARRNKHYELGATAKHGLTEKHNCRKLYGAMAKYGIDKFQFEVILTVPLELLSINEAIFIALYDSIDHGYNIINGKTKEYELTPETEQRLKKVLSDSHTRFRHNEKSRGLPLYLFYRKDSSGEYYILEQHPHSEQKRFSIGSAQYPNDDSAKLAALEYYKTLKPIDGGGARKIKDKQETIPELVRKNKRGHGYYVQKGFTIDGKYENFKKAFTDTKIPEDKLLKMAIAHIPIIEKEVADYVKAHEDRKDPLIATEIPVPDRNRRPKNDRELPVGVSPKRRGFQFQRSFNGKYWSATFCKYEDKEDNLQEALAYAKQVEIEILLMKERLKNPPPEVDPLDID